MKFRKPFFGKNWCKNDFLEKNGVKKAKIDVKQWYKKFDVKKLAFETQGCKNQLIFFSKIIEKK